MLNTIITRIRNAFRALAGKPPIQTQGGGGGGPKPTK